MRPLPDLADDLRWLSVQLAEHQPGRDALPAERSTPRAIELATAQAHFGLALQSLARATHPPTVIDHAPLPPAVARELARDAVAEPA